MSCHRAPPTPTRSRGRYSDTLSYKAWYEFSNAQRAHYNLVENLPSVLGLHVLSGLFYPKATAASAALWIAARHVWARNYVTQGANARYGGIAGLHIFCVLGWLGASVAGGLRLTGLIKF